MENVMDIIRIFSGVGLLLAMILILAPIVLCLLLIELLANLLAVISVNIFNFLYDSMRKILGSKKS